MAHELEMINGEAQMAYAGEPCWHGLGYNVPGDLSPIQMLEAAHLDWEVNLLPTFYYNRGEKYPTGDKALVRSSDDRLLSTVSDGWNPVQNLEAAEFFNDFVAEGGMTMETAGSLCNGELVWFLAKMQDTFDVFKKRDTIDSYLLFTNPHRYGWSTSVSLTAIRVVCQNTLNLSLNSTKGDKIIKVNHRREFVAEEVKEVLGVSKEKMSKYKEAAQFLGKKKAKGEDVIEYFKRLFPVITTKENSKKEMSKMASLAVAALDTQPGADIAPGTWWNTYNAATFLVDHKAGRTVDSRLNSAWYGEGRVKKTKALNFAIEMAEAA